MPGHGKAHACGGPGPGTHTGTFAARTRTHLSTGQARDDDGAADATRCGTRERKPRPGRCRATKGVPRPPAGARRRGFRAPLEWRGAGLGAGRRRCGASRAPECKTGSPARHLKFGCHPTAAAVGRRLQRSGLWWSRRGRGLRLWPVDVGLWSWHPGRPSARGCGRGSGSLATALVAVLWMWCSGHGRDCGRGERSPAFRIPSLALLGWTLQPFRPRLRLAGPAATTDHHGCASVWVRARATLDDALQPRPHASQPMRQSFLELRQSIAFD